MHNTGKIFKNILETWDSQKWIATKNYYNKVVHLEKASDQVIFAVHANLLYFFIYVL